MPTGNDETVTLAHEIMEYFESHPNAADSVSGVLEWWLGQRACVSTEGEVTSALEYLCRTGVVTKTIGETGNAIYSSAIKAKEIGDGVCGSV